MIVHDLQDPEGRTFAFEVENIGRDRICEIIRSFPKTNLLRNPKWLSELREEEFCEFEFDGQRFMILEPFGDNSRYWIGPEPPHWCRQVAALRTLLFELP